MSIDHFVCLNANAAMWQYTDDGSADADSSKNVGNEVINLAGQASDTRGNNVHPWSVGISVVLASAAGSRIAGLQQVQQTMQYHGDWQLNHIINVTMRV